MDNNIKNEVTRMILSGEIKLKIRKKKVVSSNKRLSTEVRVLVLSVDGAEQVIADGVALDEVTWRSDFLRE